MVTVNDLREQIEEENFRASLDDDMMVYYRPDSRLYNKIYPLLFNLRRTLSTILLKQILLR